MATLIALLVIVVWLACLYFFELHPPIGMYIALMGLMAVVVTVWPAENPRTKAVWLVVFFLLTGFEIHNLYRERDRQKQQQATAREEERKAFKAIADGIEASINQNQLAFDTTMRRMEHLSGSRKRL